MASLHALEQSKSVRVSLVGEEKAARGIFHLDVDNRSNQPVLAYIPVGVVLVPTNSRYQSMILDDPVSVCTSEHAKVDLPMHGYCLNHVAS